MKRGSHYTPEQLERVLKANAKRTMNPTWRKNTIAAAKKLTKTPEWHEKITTFNRKMTQTPEWRAKTILAGRKRSLDATWQQNQRKGAIKRANNIEWHRNLSKAILKSYKNSDVYARVVTANRKLTQTPQWIEKRRKTAKMVASRPEWKERHSMVISKALSLKGPSEAERQMMKKLSIPPWRYVGDGKFPLKTQVTTRFPDFINEDTHEIIEIFGTYWHRNQNPLSLITEYKNVGWSCRVLWESEIGTFHG
jgi:hypothetical protein